MSRHERTYRTLLVAYPPEHRREYAEPMAQLFADRFRDEGGGIRSLTLWVQVLLDLGKSAFTERLETSMRSFTTDWWRLLAIPLAVFVAVASVGLPFEPEDTAGPDWLVGAIAYAVVSVIGLGLVITGLVIRRRNRKVGSTMIAAGVLPAFPMAIMFWFPPVALVGVLAMAISIKAITDAPKAPQSVLEPTRQRLRCQSEGGPPVAGSCC